MRAEPVAPGRLETLLSGPLALVAIAAAVFAAWGNGLDGAFVFDDAISIVQHEEIGILWPPSVPLTGPHESPSSGRPLVSLSLALNYAAGGLDPYGYHLVNVAVHLLVSLLLWRIARDLLRRTPAAAGHPGTLATCIALLFAVHPLASSVVTYVSQRAESMMALFLLGAVASWMRMRGGGRRGPWGFAAVLCCFLATLCKEVGYAAPLVVLLVDHAFYAKDKGSAWRSHRGLVVAMFASWLVLLAGPAMGARGATVTWSYRDYDSWTYLLTSARAILHYLSLIAWPTPLVLDYGWPIVHRLSEVWWQAALLAATLIGCLLGLRARPRLAFLGLSCFLILGPSSSVLPIVTEIMAEHRMYLPSAFVLAGVVVGLHGLGKRLALPGGAAFAGLGLVVALGTLIQTARIQNRLYANPLALYAHNTRHVPDNYRAHYNLGYHLSRADRYAEAAESLRRALSIDPTCAPAHRELSYVACYTGNLDAALGHIQNALRFKPEDPMNLVANGSFLALLGRPDEGLGLLERALELSPGFSEALKWRVNVLLLAKKGRAADRALAQYAPGLSPAERQRDLQARYRDLVRMMRADETP